MTYYFYISTSILHERKPHPFSYINTTQSQATLCLSKARQNHFTIYHHMAMDDVF